MYKPKSVQSVVQACSRALGDSPQEVMPPQRRVVALGDVHGDYEALVVCLRDVAEVADITEAPRRVRWTGRDTVLVVVGDTIDRYRPGFTAVDARTGRGSGEFRNEEEAVVDLLNYLAVQAARAGGRVVRLIGNHEVMNLDGQADYATPFALRHGRGRRFRQGQPGAAKLQACGALPMVRVGHWTFVHAGIMPGVVESLRPHMGATDDLFSYARRKLRETFEGLRDDAADALFRHSSVACAEMAPDADPDRTVCSVLWDRRQGAGEHGYCGNTQSALRAAAPTRTLEGKQRIVVAHSTQTERVSGGFAPKELVSDEGRRYVCGGPLRPVQGPVGINAACDGTVWRVDVAMSRAFDGKGTQQHWADPETQADVRARRPAVLEILWRGGDRYDTRVLVAKRGLPRFFAREPDSGLPEYLAA